MKKNIFIEELKKELENNILFKDSFIKAIMYDYESIILKNEGHKTEYYTLINVLEALNDYINYTGLLFDIILLLKRRFNEDITYNNIIKCLNILATKENEY